MNSPQIELLPLRPVISSDRPSTLDLLVRIIPPAVAIDFNRPALNLGFVIDRSGSMGSQKKIEFAHQAAVYAVQQLQMSDRISVTIFDDQVETLIPSTPAVEKSNIIRKIESIQPRGSTALHAGWLEGGVQVSQYLNPEHINRVLLLSDGLANVGETNPDVIASDVHGLARRGVSTSTMGVGNDYSEDLLEAIARSGDGNYYYIESPQQLPDIFHTELQGLIATIGHTVSLGIEPQAGVEVVDVFNDLDKNRNGRYQLPNLVIGNLIEVILRLKVPAMTQATNFCFFRLAWNDPNQEQRQVQRVTLQLPVVPFAQLEEFPLNPEVQQQVARLMAAPAKAEAVKSLDRGDFVAAGALLQAAKVHMMTAPASAVMAMELNALANLDADLAAGDVKRARKRATYQNYQARRGESFSS
jgi:Ca-activated chloride channel family protein